MADPERSNEMDTTQSPPEVTEPSPTIWDREGEDPPVIGAPPDDVAEHLMELEACGVFGGDYAFPLTMRQAKFLCEADGHNWRKVSPRFREHRAIAIEKRLDNARVVVRPDGIVINESLMAELKDLNSLPACPYPLTKWERHSFERETYTRKCNKWWCLDCGPDRIDGLLTDLKTATRDQETVYTASATNCDKAMVGRVRQQRKEKGAELLRVLRSDCTVFYVASADLGGRKPPCEWTERTLDEAIGMLLNEALVIPSYHDHGWSKGWRPVKSDDESSSGTGWSNMYITFALEEGAADQVERELRPRVRDRFGCDLGKVPLSCQDDVEAMLAVAVQDVRRRGMSGFDL